MPTASRHCTGVSLAGFNVGTATAAVGASFAGDTTDENSSASGDLTVSPAPATLTPSGLTVTYDGMPQTVTITTSPAGLSGVSVTYTQGGTTVAAPTGAGSYAFTVSLANPNYTAPNATGTLVINPATPTIAWPDPAAITYGTALSGTQLDASASFDGSTVAGTFTYSPAPGTVLGAGSQTVSATFTPTDTTDYQSVSTQTTLVVNPATPSITWANPTDITSGTPLGTGQLDATTSVPGTFSLQPRPRAPS